MSGRRFLTGAAILTVGRMAGYGLSFARNLILARVLAKADYGLAAAFSMTVVLLEFAGGMSAGTQLIQSRKGNDEDFQGAAHCFQMMMALLGGAVMLVLAAPMARTFNVPQLGGAFLLLAIVPLSKGLEHLDYARLQREFNFLPGVMCEAVPQLVVTAAAWPLTVWLPDYRAILVLMIAKSVLSILLSHWVAHRPFRCCWHRGHMGSMFRFGLPLLLTGFLIFASQQGGQMLVGAYYSLTDLAEYALAFSLVSVPGMLFASVASALMLPVLSKCQDDTEMFRRQYRLCMELGALVVALLLFPLMLLGEQVVVMLYGNKYEGAGLLVAVLGAAFAFRLLRIPPTIAATARADTMNNLYSNLWRCGGLPVAFALAASGASVVWVVASGLIGEALAAAFSLWRLRVRDRVPFRESVGSLLFVTIGSGAVGLCHAVPMSDAPWARLGMSLLVLAGVCVFAGLLLLPRALAASRHSLHWVQPRLMKMFRLGHALK